VLGTLLKWVKKFPSCPACPSPNHSSCLENGIGYREKCFYFVEDEAEWNRSETFCRSLGAHLATIDTWQELRFLLRYGGSLHYWIGLRREGSAPWTWFNGSLFNNSYWETVSSCLGRMQHIEFSFRSVAQVPNPGSGTMRLRQRRRDQQRLVLPDEILRVQPPPDASHWEPAGSRSLESHLKTPCGPRSCH
uniref:C-type lectin domain-containing protein n=1 Tax=Strigops habroptila TaxID=2489341 RepID=A0A672U441_STRHB